LHTISRGDAERYVSPVSTLHHAVDEDRVSVHGPVQARLRATRPAATRDGRPLASPSRAYRGYNPARPSPAAGRGTQSPRRPPPTSCCAGPAMASAAGQGTLSPQARFVGGPRRIPRRCAELGARTPARSPARISRSCAPRMSPDSGVGRFRVETRLPGEPSRGHPRRGSPSAATARWSGRQRSSLQRVGARQRAATKPAAA